MPRSRLPLITCAVAASAVGGVALPAATARAEVVQNDAAEAGARVIFMGGFGGTEWFASTFDVPEELVPWRLCRILAWIGPNGISPFTARMWNDPEGIQEFDFLDILWDTGDDAYQFTGSQQRISAIDLRHHDLVYSERRVRVGFRHTEGFPAPPSIAADTDGFQPRVNHINAVVPQIDRIQRWYTVDDLPEAAQPPGDWVLRLEIAGEDELCPNPGDGPGPIIPGEGEGEGGGDGGGDQGGGDQGGGGAGGGDGGGADDGGGDGGGPDPRPEPAPAPTGELRLDLAVPDSLPNDENQQFALLGDGFLPGSEVTLACPGCGGGAGDLTVSAFDVQVRSAQALTARAPAPDMPVATYDVTVRRPDGAFATLPNGVSVLALSGDGAPVIQGVVPDSVAAGSGAPLLVEGIGFAPGALAFLDDVALGDVQVLSSTRLIASVPTALGTGVYDLTIKNPGGLVSPPWPVSLTGGGVAQTEAPPVGSGGGCAQGASLRSPGIAWFALLLGGRCSNGPTAGAGAQTPTPRPATSGAGARIRPVGSGESLAAAMASAAPGDALALAAGTWSEELTLDKPVTVYGPAEQDAGAAVVSGLVVAAGVVGATVARLQVRGAGDLVRVDPGADVVLSKLTVHSDSGRAVGVHGGRARLEELTVLSAWGEAVLFADQGAGDVISADIRSVTEHQERNTGSCVAAVNTAGPVRVRQSRLADCALRGVRVFQSTGVTIESNEIAGAGLVGVSVTADSDATVIGNRIHGSAGAAVTAGIGVSIDRAKAVVRDNDIDDSGLFGVRTEEATATVQGNRIRRSGQRGISVSRGDVRLLANVIEDHPDFGIFVADAGAQIDRNQISKATGVGLWVSGPLPEGAAVSITGNRVEQTVALQGTGPDVAFATGEALAIVRAGTPEAPVTVHDNDLGTGDGNGVAMDRAVATLTDNRIHSNGLAGLSIATVPAPGFVRLTGNRITGNRGAGLELIASAAALSGNTIIGNGGDGIFLVAGASASLDGDIIEDNARYGVMCVGGALTDPSGSADPADPADPAPAQFASNALGETQGCATP